MQNNYTVVPSIDKRTKIVGFILWFIFNQRDLTISLIRSLYWYWVIHKKLSHKTEDKMQEKMKIILQVDENLAHI